MLREKSGRLLFIDGLRGIAAVMVVLYHLCGRTDAAWLTQFGYLGVAVFFVLSGYVITMVVGGNPISWGFLGRFAARRSLRLDPPYWASILVSIALALLAVKMGVAKEFPETGDVVLHLFYLQDLTGTPAISPVYWTLCLEVQFYLTLILCLWTGRGIPLVIALGAWSILEHAHITSLAPHGLFVKYWFAFALGALCYWSHAGRVSMETTLAAIFVVLACSSLDSGWFLTSAATAGVLCLANHRHAMGRWLAAGIMQWFGKVSYSLYLFHPLVGWSAQSLALKYANQWVALAVGLLASVISAWLAHLVIERPAIRLSHLVRAESRSAREPTTVDQLRLPHRPRSF